MKKFFVFSYILIKLVEYTLNLVLYILTKFCLIRLHISYSCHTNNWSKINLSVEYLGSGYPTVERARLLVLYLNRMKLIFFY